MRKVLKITLIVSVILVAFVALFTGLYINNIMKSQKNVVFDKNKIIMQANQISLLDSGGEDFSLNSQITKNIVKVEELPSCVTDAFVSIEDKRFYDHKGLDYKRIVKAMFNNVKSKSFSEGASTISQQLIKNTHLSNEKTIKRKISEMLLTKKLEKNFSKKDIIETYLNIIYFGEGSYGIEQASQKYFSKSATELTINETALLTGLIKSPAKYSPIYENETAIQRKNLVLRQMLLNKKITQAQFDELKNNIITLNIKTNNNDEFNLYANAVVHEAKKLLKMSEKEIFASGLKIHTHLDKNKQSMLTEIVNNDDYYHVNSFGNVADSLSVIIDNDSYGVVAFSGKSNYDLTSFKRQPGSVLKPAVVYAPAFEYGLIHTQTQLLDEPINYNGYTPNNVGNTFSGYVSVKDSISKSLNIPAIKTLEYVGIEKGKIFANKLGINFDKNDSGYAVALGGLTFGNTLLEITNSYVPFANEGSFKHAQFISKIEDRNGKTLYENTLKPYQVLSSDTAYLMTDTLIDGVKNGTSKKLTTLPFEVAGKTGTVSISGTNNNTDAYSIAYTKNHTMGVWLGNYSNNKEFVLEGKNNGGTFATAMIKDSFSKMYESNLPQSFEVPESVVELEIDSKTLEEEHVIKLPMSHVLNDTN